MKRSTVRSIIIVLALIVIFFAVGLRFAHPQVGIANALGSAESSVAVYKEGSVTQPDKKVIFTTPEGKTGLGVITVSEGDTLFVNDGTRVEQVTPKNIRGELMAVLPFLGSLMGLLGL